MPTWLGREGGRTGEGAASCAASAYGCRAQVLSCSCDDDRLSLADIAPSVVRELGLARCAAWREVEWTDGFRADGGRPAVTVDGIVEGLWSLEALLDVIRLACRRGDGRKLRLSERGRRELAGDGAAPSG